MSWKDRVPRERITLSRVRDGDMDKAIRDVLSEADRDPAFPRLPPVTDQEPDRDVVVPTWPDYRLLSLTHLGLIFGHWLRRNEAIHWILWDKVPDFPSGLQNATKFLTSSGVC